jgi:hypothetical protein
VLERRNRDAEDPSRPHHHDLARVSQVAGQEDDEADLGELGGLEHEHSRDPHAQIGPVGLVSDPGQAGQQQQAERDEGDDVPVLLKLAVVPEDDDRDREQNQAEYEPLGLLAGVGGADPVDHHDPEARQQRHQGKHVGIRVRQRDADEDVPGDAQAEEDRPVGERHVREHVRALNEDARKTGGDQQRGRDQAEQLTVARAHPRTLTSTPGRARAP